MMKAFAATLLIFLTLGGFMFWRSGYYKEVEISGGEQGPFLLVYRIHKGPYHKVNALMTEIEESLAKASLPCPLAFGLYLHDPKAVDEDRLESEVGCAYPLGSIDPGKLPIDQGLQQRELERKEYVVATFAGSPSLGPLKVYPEVQSWLAKYGYQQDGPVLELYQTMGEDAVTTRYLFSYK